MSAKQEQQIVWTGMKGRDGSKPSTIGIPKDRFKEAINVDLYRAEFARKRGGSDDVFATTTGEAFTGVLSSLFRYVPGADPTAAQLWGVDDAATPVVMRLTGGTAWASVTLVDAIASKPWEVSFAVLNSKLFMAYDSTVDRLHVYTSTAGKVRRTGLQTPAAPTVANTGSGSYAAIARYYKVAYAVLSGSTVLYRSELSASVTFTPSGSGTAARVTKPASISEDETHWILYGSFDDEVYHFLSTIAVGTTTYDDSADPLTYSGDAPPLAGTHTNWTSVKYLLSTGRQLLGAGSWESGGYNNRVWYSAFLGQTTAGDDESVIQTDEIKNYVDVDENDGGVVVGLGGPLDGRPLVFKTNQVWRLVPTGLDSTVYVPRPIFKGSGLGCIRHQTIVTAIDEGGRPAVYWLSNEGPYRIGSDGPQAMVDDVQDVWNTVNLAATNVTAFSVYHPDKKQVWWWIATGSSNDPDTLLIYDVTKGRPDDVGRVRGGWTKYTGNIAAARCACLFSNTLAAAMSRDLKPYIGRSTGTAMLKADTTATDDAGTDFQAYVDLPDTHFAGLFHKCKVAHPLILGNAGSQSLQITLTMNYGEVAGRTGSQSMAARGSETRVLRAVESIEFGDDAYAIQPRIGDSAASDQAWTIDAFGFEWERREQVKP